MTPLQEPSPARCHSSTGKARVDQDGCDVEPIVNLRALDSKNMDAKSQPKSPRYIVICLAILVFVVQFGASLSDVPSVRLLEDIICHQFYGITSTAMIAEDQCLVDAIQGELNVISTGSLIFGYLPGILAAIPYGALADRRGRRGVLFVCIVGMILSQLWWIAVAWNWQLWDLRYVWASSVPTLIGGGESVAEAMVFAIIADIAVEEKRAILFQVEICSVLLAEAIAPFVATAMMNHSVWLPILVSPAIMAIGCLLITLIPETLDVKQKEMETNRSKVTPTIPIFSTPVQRYTAQDPEAASTWSRLRNSFVPTLRLLKTRNVSLLLPSASLTIPVATVTLAITLRYIPVRFGWTLTQAGMVLGVRTGFNVLVLLVFIPLLGDILLSKQDEKDRDLVLARISAVFLVVGQILFSAAPNAATALFGLVVLTLGTGLPSLSRAVLTRFVDRQYVGRVFGLLAVFEMLGYIFSGVGFGALFQVGLAFGLGSDGELSPEGRLFLGMVFSAAAVVYFCLGGFLWLVRLKGQGTDAESLHSDAPGCQSAYEMRILADGRVTRKCPSLENVAIAI